MGNAHEFSTVACAGGAVQYCSAGSHSLLPVPTEIPPGRPFAAAPAPSLSQLELDSFVRSMEQYVCAAGVALPAPSAAAAACRPGLSKDKADDP